MNPGAATRVLVVDLNNFAMYPTVAVGYLAAVLRQAGVEVEVYSPLSTGVTGVMREPRAKPWSRLEQRWRYRTAVSRRLWIHRARQACEALAAPALARQGREVADAVGRKLSGSRYDAALISTYLMYRPVCERIAAHARKAGTPLLIGGAYFAQPEVVREWINIEGCAGIVGGEVERELPEIIEALARGESLDRFAGVWTRGERGELRGEVMPPRQELDRLPFPDYRDFPWERYPHRIIPIITGRGCGWGACTFCSDVTSTAGRSFRSRSPANVLAEVRAQAQHHEARRFVFTDLKLNSSLEMWRGIIAHLQDAVPGAEWVASVHVGVKQPNGLSAGELQAARRSGLVRLTTGLESGSERVLRRMGKGTSLEATSRFLRDSREAGISVRTTMIIGYPGEETEDVEQTRGFLMDHRDCIERVVLNRFQLMTGTAIHRRLERLARVEPLGHDEAAERGEAASRSGLGGITQLTVNHEIAQIAHHYRPTERRDYRRAIGRLIDIADSINRRPLRPTARAFEGVM